MSATLAVLQLFDKKLKNKTITILCATEQGCHDSFLEVMRAVKVYSDLADWTLFGNKKEVKNNDTGSILKVINMKANPELLQRRKTNIDWIEFDEFDYINQPKEKDDK